MARLVTKLKALFSLTKYAAPFTFLYKISVSVHRFRVHGSGLESDED